MTIRRNGATQALTVRPKRTRLADVALPLLTIFTGRNGKWVAWTQQGFYTCSPGSDELFGWQVNQGLDRAADFHPAKSFQAAPFRPDLVKSILESHGKPANLPENLSIDQLLASSTPPTIRFLHPSEGSVVDSPEIELAISITHPNQAKIDALDITINGRSPRAIRVRPKIEDQVFKEKIPLSRGKNIIGVRAVMSGGILSDPRTVSISCTAADAGPRNAELPNLYVLAVGVARYPVRELELRYAAKDATDLVAAFQIQQGKQFAEVHTKLLVDQEATRVKVLEGLSWLKSHKLRPQDHVVLFMSGHGGLDESDNYCFVAVDSQVNKLSETGLRWSDVRQSLSRLAGRPFLFLDTCHAGGAAGCAVRFQRGSHRLQRRAARCCQRLLVRDHHGRFVPAARIELRRRSLVQWRLHQIAGRSATRKGRSESEWNPDHLGDGDLHFPTCRRADAKSSELVVVQDEQRAEQPRAVRTK